MRRLLVVGISALCLLACVTATNAPAQISASNSAAATEIIYADLLDAYGAFSAIDSGLIKSYDGKDRQAWEAIYHEKRDALVAQLSRLPANGLSKNDARAAVLMRASLSDFPADASTLSPASRCKNAQNTDLAYDALRAALYSCFDELANNLQFEGATVNRVSAFSLLEQIKEPERRKSLFLAFNPLWEAVNAKDQPDSPYRRMIRMASAEAAKHQATKQGSAITAAADSLGVQPLDVETWLEQILDTWRQVSGDTPVEPWDYRYIGGETGRLVDGAIPRESLQRISERYYHDLGADLTDLGVLYDLDPRPGKAPLAYTDLLRCGRMVNGVWRPAIARVSANYGRGGFSNLSELVHEQGHAVHFVAVRARPAFTYPDSLLFIEAFADGRPRLTLAELAQRTGFYPSTILRLAACLGVEAHIIEPAGFPISDRAFRRAGMDYLDRVSISRHPTWAAFEAWRSAAGARLVLFTTRASMSYLDYAFRQGDVLLFGRESAGVPDRVHAAADARLTIPMQEGMRSLNVAMAAALAVGEALRQAGGFSDAVETDSPRTRQI